MADEKKTHEALNDVTDALERLRAAIEDDDEDLMDAFEEFQDAIGKLKTVLVDKLSSRPGPETA